MLQVMLLGLVAAAGVEASSAPPSALDRHLEVQLVPATLQMNTLTTEHFGTLGRVMWRINPYFAVYVGGGFNWLNRPSPAMDELSAVQRLDVFRTELGQQTSPVQQTWQSFVGVETVPLRGRFSLLGDQNGEFGLAAFAGIGAGGARVRLKPETVRADSSTSPATFGEAGPRMLGHFGGALRFGFAAFTVSLGVRATLWSNRVDRINGCSIDDLRGMDAQIRMGNDPGVAKVSQSCAVFATNDIPLAMTVVRVPNDTVSANLAGELGVSWSFF